MCSYPIRPHGILPILAVFLLLGQADDLRGDEEKDATSYAETVAEDAPILWWRLSSAGNDSVANSGAAAGDEHPLVAVPTGNVDVDVSGPMGEEFPDFRADNRAIGLSKGANYLRVVDPGADSPLDFTNGDAITIEAWVKPVANPGVGYGYIIGKGRTLNSGFSGRNQNYSLRLAYARGGAKLSFYFVDDETPHGDGTKADGHRWTSTASMSVDDRWHHVALVYKFGEPETIRAYIDGVESQGRWDLAGPTRKRPVVDDDELWIGSSMQGRATMRGAIDEVAIYRRMLTGEEIESHVNIRRRDEILAAVQSVLNTAPVEHVQIDVFERVADGRNWSFKPTQRQGVYQSDVFALTELPRKYNDKALIVDRPAPILIHASSRITLPAGNYRLLLRSLNAARLYLDDKLVAETPFLKLAGNGHGKVYQLEPSQPDRVSLPAAHNERIVPFEADGGSVVVSLLAQAGHQGRLAELGELVVAVAGDGEIFRLLGSDGNLPVVEPERKPASAYRRFDDEGWIAFLDRDAQRRLDWERQERFRLSEAERDYWRLRHEWTRRIVDAQVQIPRVERTELTNNALDHFIEHRLEAEGVEPSPVIGDRAFLRRMSLDVVGTIPTSEQIDRFFADPPATRRSAAIDRLLEEPGWADHWVGYWQHVLAENPGLTKPSLNNSGPFRWFIYESFRDNKPFDRFVTELVMMEGGRRSGGPAGFGVATNNDSPLAAKAHILGATFLGVEMKCARCHDAPSHASTQQDLFSLAAMLSRKPLAVPPTSTVPGDADQLARMAVTVSLRPGVPVQPDWPFAEFSAAGLDDVPSELLRAPADPRAQLAWHITHPRNRRFAEVIVNRLWKRYLGRGLIDQVHDWEGSGSSHPQLLAYLAHELVAHDYNLQHVARLILNSQAYQRQADDRPEERELFASTTRRRMSAEQVADSVFLAVGKPFDVEELNMNADGRQSLANFQNLGAPRRAWQFACTANERERPSMTLPRAQSVIDLMMSFGWRQSRQEPINERVEEPTPLTSLVLVNGVAVSRAIDLSDNGRLVDLCLQEQPVHRLVERLFTRFLGRKPNVEEAERFVALLNQGYDARATAAARTLRTVDRSPLTWSNNLDAEANRIGVERQNLALQGDPPTRRLTSGWRERVEDVVWVLVNSPEFVIVP